MGIALDTTASTVLMEALGSPQRALPHLLVAGTNGKGSVVALLDAALSASGLRVGCYTSPHFSDFEERGTRFVELVKERAS